MKKTILLREVSTSIGIEQNGYVFDGTNLTTTVEYLQQPFDHDYGGAVMGVQESGHRGCRGGATPRGRHAKVSIGGADKLHEGVHE